MVFVILQDGLKIPWTDVFHFHKVETSSLNVERASILLNIAVFYYQKAEELFRVDLVHNYNNQDVKSADSLNQICAFGQKSLSAIIFIRTHIVPYIENCGVGWDLTSTGIEVVRIMSECYVD